MALTPPPNAAASATMRSIVKRTLRACSSRRQPAGVVCTPRRAAHQQLDAEVVLELGDPLADRRHGSMCSCSAARAIERQSQTATNRRSVFRSMSRTPNDRPLTVPFRKPGILQIHGRGSRGTSQVTPTPASDGGPALGHAPCRAFLTASSSARSACATDCRASDRPADRAQAQSGSAHAHAAGQPRSRSARSFRPSCCRSLPTPPSWSPTPKTLPGLVRLGAGAEPEGRRARDRKRRRS
mgnify:CR=1 FL=1